VAVLREKPDRAHGTRVAGPRVQVLLGQETAVLDVLLVGRRVQVGAPLVVALGRPVEGGRFFTATT